MSPPPWDTCKAWGRTHWPAGIMRCAHTPFHVLFRLPAARGPGNCDVCCPVGIVTVVCPGVRFLVYLEGNELLRRKKTTQTTSCHLFAGLRNMSRPQAAAVVIETRMYCWAVWRGRLTGFGIEVGVSFWSAWALVVRKMSSSAILSSCTDIGYMICGNTPYTGCTKASAASAGA